MDFNTGTGGTGGTGGSPREPGGPPPSRTSGVAAGAEFNYTDPVQSFISTVQRVVLQPTDFYRGIQRRGDFLNPLIFAIICYVVFTILSGLLALVGVGQQQGFGGFIVSLILAPIFAAIGLFIGAGILHLLVMLIVGSGNSGFEATFRVGAYATVTSLVSWIPIIGWIASLYGIYLAIMGVREVHGTTTGRAALVVLLPIAVIGFLVIVLLIVLGVGAAIFFSTQQ
jgi:hypothetical protein